MPRIGAGPDDRTDVTDGIRVHLVDGTWELFRHHFGMPSGVRSRDGAAARVDEREIKTEMKRIGEKMRVA